MLDRREREGDIPTALLAMGEGLQAGIWTALPGILKSFDPEKMTCTVQPTIRSQVLQKDGTYTWMDLPLLLDCPIQFPAGGGVMLTFPLAVGDEGLVIFASRCIDAWWQSGGVQVQADIRMHDLSDGFFIPGVRSIPNVPASINATRAELRSVDGQATISLDPASHEVAVTTTGPANITAGQASVWNIAGKLTINATAGVEFSSGTGVVIDGKTFATHEHTGVTSGANNTGGVA